MCFKLCSQIIANKVRAWVRALRACVGVCVCVCTPACSCACVRVVWCGVAWCGVVWCVCVCACAWLCVCVCVCVCVCLCVSACLCVSVCVSTKETLNGPLRNSYTITIPDVSFAQSIRKCKSCRLISGTGSFNDCLRRGSVLFKERASQAQQSSLPQNLQNGTEKSMPAMRLTCNHTERPRSWCHSANDR